MEQITIIDCIAFKEQLLQLSKKFEYLLTSLFLCVKMYEYKNEKPDRNTTELKFCGGLKGTL